MSNLIEIDFSLCDPAPSDGYRVRYQPQAGGPLLTWSTRFTTTPAIFDDGGAQPDGTLYQGFIDADCGVFGFGPAVAWATPEESASDSASASASASPPPCICIEINGITLPDAVVGEPYSQIITLSGDAPFALDSTESPSWMDIALVGNEVHFTGTPDTPEIGTTVSFTATNCDGDCSDTFEDVIDVVEESASVPPCEGVSLVEGSVPDGVVGEPYSVDLHLTGDVPFTLGSYSVPSWMSVTLVVDVVELRGTPDAPVEEFPLSIPISNCDGASTDTMTDGLTVTEPPPGVGNVSLDSCFEEQGAVHLSDVKWNGVTVGFDAGFPMDAGNSSNATVPAAGTHTLAVSMTGFVVATGRVTVTDSDGSSSCQGFSSLPNTFSFPGFVINDGEPWSIVIDCSSC